MTVLFSSLPCSKFEKNERRQIKNKTLIQLHNPQIITQRCSVFFPILMTRGGGIFQEDIV